MKKIKNFNPNLKSFILDTEIVAYDVWNKKIRSFQSLKGRFRKKNVNEKEIKIKVCVFMFDLIYLNG